VSTGAWRAISSATTSRRLAKWGGATIKNGELLALAANHFDVFVTVDRNLSFQQNLASFSIAVIIIRAKSNRLADLRPLTPHLLGAIESVGAGAAKFIEVE
jgi:hypothetical protein